MKLWFFGIFSLSLMIFVSCENSEGLTEGNENTDMSINNEAIISVLEADSADLFFDALDDRSEDNFGNDPNWLGGETLNKFSYDRIRFGRIATRPTERSIDIIYDSDSTATAHIHTRFEGKFVIPPANLIVTTIDINPRRTKEKEQVRVMAEVTNNGGVTGTQEVEVKLKDKVLVSEELNVTPGASQRVNITLTNLEPGTHEVKIGDFRDTFAVEMSNYFEPESNHL